MISFRTRTGLTALAYALAAQAAYAQTAAPTDDGIDVVVPPDNAATESTAPAATGDPVLDRLNALEAKVKTLEARNRELEAQQEFATGRIEAVETRAAKSAQPGIVPTYADPAGQFSFKVRGVVDVDYAGFNERAGGYDYNSGTAFRRARLGFEGDAFKVFKWRLEADFAGNVVALQDAYVQYVGIKPLTITLGQHKTPFGLESNNSDNYNTFLERGLFNAAAGDVGGERRIGLSAAYIRDNFTLTAGVFGENESIGRAANSTATAVVTNNGRPISDTNTPDEGWGVNGRVTWEPINDTGKIVHVGAAAYWRTGLRDATAGDVVRLSNRPNIRVDNGRLVDTGNIPNVDSAAYLGAEAAVVYGPFSLVGEYGRLELDRTGVLSDPSFDGFYVYGSWFLTGETRAFRNGNFDRVKPRSNFDSKGGWGAWEVALRYDRADFSETPVAARLGNKGDSLTLGLNWYLNPNTKLQLNYIRFEGDNTPLDPVGTRTKGDALGARLHLDW